MSYADPLAFERERCAQIESRARARDLELRRELIRQEHRQRRERDRVEYQAGPIARAFRMQRLREFAREMKQARAARRATRERRRADDRILGRKPLTWRQRLADRIRGWGRGGNGQRERVEARSRPATQRVKPQPQATRSSWAGPEKQQQKARTRARSRGRCR